MEQNRVGYWLRGFDEDSTRLDDQHKTELIKHLLVYTVPLKPEEADRFLCTPYATPDDVLNYSVVERKVAQAFSGDSCPPEGNEQFVRCFRNVLSGFYTSQELDEAVSYMLTASDFTLAVHRLVGRDNHDFRRIRNAYLPEITDLITIDLTSGKGYDMTHTLFNGPGDAVDQIESLLGVKKDSPPNNHP